MLWHLFLLDTDFSPDHRWRKKCPFLLFYSFLFAPSSYFSSSVVSLPSLPSGRTRKHFYCSLLSATLYCHRFLLSPPSPIPSPWHNPRSPVKIKVPPFLFSLFFLFLYLDTRSFNSCKSVTAAPTSRLRSTRDFPSLPFLFLFCIFSRFLFSSFSVSVSFSPPISGGILRLFFPLSFYLESRKRKPFNTSSPCLETKGGRREKKEKMAALWVPYLVRERKIKTSLFSRNHGRERERERERSISTEFSWFVFLPQKVEKWPRTLLIPPGLSSLLPSSFTSKVVARPWLNCLHVVAKVILSIYF